MTIKAKKNSGMKGMLSSGEAIIPLAASITLEQGSVSIPTVSDFFYNFLISSNKRIQI
jgi:hypothetical protein